MKILSIGNSFSVDATEYLHKMAKSAGVEIETHNMYIGGCSLEMHEKNYLSDEAAYEFYLNGESTGEYVSISEMLDKDEWDYITLQQASHFSINFKTYMPYILQLSNQVRVACPKAKQFIHQTWAYEDGSQRLTEELGYNSFNDMYADIEKAYAQAAELISAPQIPCGRAFYIAHEKGIAPLHRDTFHAQIPQGRYLLAAVWLEFFAGVNASEGDFVPEGMSVEEKKLLDSVAHEAVMWSK